MDNLNSALKRIKKKKQVNEVVQAIPAVLAKGAAVAGKVVTKAGAAAAKGTAKGAQAAAKGAKAGAKATGKAVKKGTKVADRMSKAFDKNKDLIKNKRGLPSKKVANSGKKTVDPKKNNLPDMSKTQPDGVDKKTSQKTLDDKKGRMKDKISDLAQGGVDASKTAGEVAGKVIKKVKDTTKAAVGGATAGFGGSSFKKESRITFQEFIDKTP